MKVIVIGATGTIGKEVVNLLSSSHEVIGVAHRSGDFQVDITSKASIDQLYRAVEPFDALISTAGGGRFARLNELTDEDYMWGLTYKLMGQVNLVRMGQEYIKDGGSFTFTSGAAGRYPIPGSSSISMVNAGLEGFVRAAALEMERGVRINVVSPIFVKETAEAMKLNIPKSMPAAKVALSYKVSIESQRNGEVLDVRDFA